MTTQLRSAPVRIEILSGRDTLSRGAHLAREVWNAALQRHRTLSRQQGFPPHKFDQLKKLRREPPGNLLNDRCFSTIISELAAATGAFRTRRRRDPRARPPRHKHSPRSLTFQLGHNAKISAPWIFRLTVLTKKCSPRHAVVRLSPPPGIKMTQMKYLVINPDFSGFILYRLTRSPTTPPGNAVAAIDLGVVNLATVAFSNGESILYSGRGLLSELQHLHKRIQACKPAGWRKGLNIRRFSARRTRYQRRAGHIHHLALHNLSHHLVEQCRMRGVGTLAIGNLTHIHRGKSYGYRMNRQLFGWAFAKLTRFIRYKAADAGIRVVPVNEAFSSVTCHRCGKRGQRRHRGLFHCPDCDITINADLNAAFNLLNRQLETPVFPRSKNAHIISPTAVAKFNLKTFGIKSET